MQQVTRGSRVALVMLAAGHDLTEDLMIARNALERIDEPGMLPEAIRALNRAAAVVHGMQIFASQMMEPGQLPRAVTIQHKEAS